MNLINGLEKDTAQDPRVGSTAMTSGSATVYITDDAELSELGYSGS